MPPTTQKMSTADFAKSIKQKYPQYESIDDNTLAQKMIAKYPVYADKVDMAAPVIGAAAAPAPSQPTSFMQKVGGAAKAVGNFFTSSEQGMGQDIASSITAPTAVKAANSMTEADTKYLSTLFSLKKKAQASGEDTSHWDKLIQNYKGQNATETMQGISPALGKSNLDIGMDFAGTAADILTAGTYGKATEGMKTGELAAKAAPTVLKKVGEAAAKDATEKVTEMVSPRLTPKVAAAVEKTAPKGILGKISAVASERTKQIASAVEKVVSPSKTFTENAVNVDKAIVTEAEKLKAAIKAADHPYTFKELKSTLKAIDIPEFIKTSEKSVQNRATRIVNKFMEIANSKDGNVSSLLDARKEFDVWVKKEYPRVFDEGGNAINKLVKNVRTAANDFIADNVKDVGVKKSLKLQNLMYEASDILHGKAAKGELKKAGEIGTTNIERFVAKHPIVKTGAKLAGGAILGGTGLGLASEGVKKLTGQ